MSNHVLPVGTRVLVTHDLGVEVGTVLGRTNPAMPDDHLYGRYDVQFDDGTISSWGWHVVERAS